MVHVLIIRVWYTLNPPGARIGSMQKLKFTYRHYCQLPEGDRRELIEGDFYVVPAPNVRHQRISSELGLRL